MWKSVQPVTPVLLAVVLMEGALGVMSPLIGFRLSSTGASTFIVGAAASAYFAGFLLGTLTCQRMINRVGHIRAFGVFAVCSSNIAILFTVLHEPVFWVALRGAAGYALAGAFVVIESWMTDKAAEESRGRVFALYTTASWAASGVSPLLLNFDKPGGILLFVLVTIGLSAAMIPLAITKVGNPEIGEHTHLPIARLFRASPTGVVCAFGSGMMNGGLYGLMPAFIDNHGYGEKELSLLYSITTIAALVTQYPIGYVSDNYGRRPVIISIMLVSTATALALYFLPDITFTQMVILFFILTAFESPLYALAIGTDHRLRREARVCGGLERPAVRLGPRLLFRAGDRRRGDAPARTPGPAAVRRRLLPLRRALRDLPRAAPPRQGPAGAERLCRRAAHPGYLRRAGARSARRIQAASPSPASKAGYVE